VATGKFDDVKVSLGFKKQFGAAFESGGKEASDVFYDFMDEWTGDVLPLGVASADEFMSMFESAVNDKLHRLTSPECVNCGDTRGGPRGHETSECTWRRDDSPVAA
jgi:hypothetical protein